MNDFNLKRIMCNTWIYLDSHNKYFATRLHDNNSFFSKTLTKTTKWYCPNYYVCFDEDNATNIHKKLTKIIKISVRWWCYTKFDFLDLLLHVYSSSHVCPYSIRKKPISNLELLQKFVILTWTIGTVHFSPSNSLASSFSWRGCHLPPHFHVAAMSPSFFLYRCLPVVLPFLVRAWTVVDKAVLS